MVQTKPQMVEKAQKTGKILVTGSSGMLGADLSKVLRSEFALVGMDFTALPSGKIRYKDFIQADITDEKETMKAVSGSEADLVIHAAAWTDVDGCEADKDKAFRINAFGTRNVAKAASENNIPILYISTDYVFAGTKNSPYKEDDPTGPLSVYGSAKLEGEKYVSSCGKYFIIRTSWLYGAAGKNFPNTIMAKAETERSFNIVDDQIGSPTYSMDLADAIKRLILIWSPSAERQATRTENREPRTELYGIYHISNTGAVSWYEYTKKILEFAGVKGVEVKPISSNELKRPAPRPKYSVMDTSRYEQVTGHKLRAWEDALKEYIDEKG